MEKLIKELNREKYCLSKQNIIAIINNINKYKVNSYEAFRILKNEGINKLEIYLVKMEFNKRKVS